MTETTVPSPETRGMGRRAARNAALVLLARVVSRVLALFGVILMARHLGDGGFGELQTCVTYSAVVAAVTDLGANTLFVRESARRPDLLERYLQNVLSIRVVLSIVAVVGLALVLRIPGLDDLLLPAFALLTLSAYSNLLRGAFYAVQRLGFEAVDIVLESAVLVGITGIGVAAHAGVAFFLWAYAASYGAACVFFVVVLMRTGLARLRWRLDAELLAPWLSAGVPLAITYVMTTLYFKVDVPILQRARGYEEVGWYTLAYRPFEALLFLPVTIRTVLFPVLSVYFQASQRRLGIAVEKLFKVLLAIGLPITVATMVLTPDITRILHLYPQSEPALRILGLGIVLVFINNTAVAALNAMDLQRVFAVLALSDLAVNVGLNLILIPRYGYLAAAATTVATEAISAVVSWALLAWHGQRIGVWRVGWRVVLAALVMAAVMLPIARGGNVAFALALLAGGVAYAGSALLLRALDADERSVLRSVVVR